MSHELKTPMAAIKVLADSLLDQRDAPADLYREFLGDIASEIDRENQIITVTTKLEPSPGTLDTVMEPLCTATALFVMASPRPVPPISLEWDLSPR